MTGIYVLLAACTALLGALYAREWRGEPYERLYRRAWLAWWLAVRADRVSIRLADWLTQVGVDANDLALELDPRPATLRQELAEVDAMTDSTWRPLP